MPAGNAVFGGATTGRSPGSGAETQAYCWGLRTQGDLPGAGVGFFYTQHIDGFFYQLNHIDDNWHPPCIPLDHNAHDQCSTGDTR